MRIKANGTKLYYKENKAKEASKSIVFIHGFPFSHKMWDAQMEILPADIKGIAYDIRGFGFSETGKMPYSIDLFADDLLALIDALNLEKPIVCGLSMGGYIALRAIEKNQEKFGGLILCDTRAEADTNETKIKRFQSIEKIGKTALGEYASESVKNLFWEESFNKVPEAVEMIKRVIEETSPSVIGKTLMAMAARTDSTSSLDDIKMPVLILVGEQDKITPPIAAQFMHEKIEYSQLEIINDAAHLSNLENPEEFNRYLLAFLDKVNRK